MKIRSVFLLLLIAGMILLSVCPVAADVAADGKIVVVIDPGHGGRDGGTQTNTHTEKEYCLALAGIIETELKADGRFDVYLTRTDDSYVSLLDRALVAHDKHADLLLSVHFNSNPETYPNGLIAYVSLVDKFRADTLSDSILDAISGAVPISRGRTETKRDTGDDLGIYYWDAEHQWDMPGAAYLDKVSDYYSMNTWASKFGVPSVIVEHGYLSNAGDRAIADDPNQLAAMGKAEARAIIDYYTGHTHSFGETVVDMPANCQLSGSMSRHCEFCGCKSDVTVLDRDPDAHYWRVLDKLPATDTEDGWVTHICQIEYNLSKKGADCTAEPVTEVIPAGSDRQTAQITETQDRNETEPVLSVQTEIPDGDMSEQTELTAGEDSGSILPFLKNPIVLAVLALIILQLILVIRLMRPQKRRK